MQQRCGGGSAFNRSGGGGGRRRVDARHQCILALNTRKRRALNQTANGRIPLAINARRSTAIAHYQRIIRVPIIIVTMAGSASRGTNN
jgi:hypothetical protein